MVPRQRRRPKPPPPAGPPPPHAKRKSPPPRAPASSHRQPVDWASGSALEVPRGGEGPQIPEVTAGVAALANRSLPPAGEATGARRAAREGDELRLVGVEDRGSLSNSAAVGVKQDSEVPPASPVSPEGTKHLSATETLQQQCRQLSSANAYLRRRQLKTVQLERRNKELEELVASLKQQLVQDRSRGNSQMRKLKEVQAALEVNMKQLEIRAQEAAAQAESHAARFQQITAERDSLLSRLRAAKEESVMLSLQLEAARTGQQGAYPVSMFSLGPMRAPRRRPPPKPM